MTVWVYYSAH